MKEFTVIWHYIANHGTVVVRQAETPEEAIDRAVGFYSEDFHRKATVFVFEGRPVHTRETLLEDHREKVRVI